MVEPSFAVTCTRCGTESYVLGLVAALNAPELCPPCAETTALGPLFDLLDAGVGQVEASRMVWGAA